MAELKEACPICAKTADGTFEKHVKWMDHLCEECTKLTIKGFVFIGAVEKKTTDVTNPYRNGQLWVVDIEVANEVFKPNPAPKSGVSFIDVNLAHQLGFADVNLKA